MRLVSFNVSGEIRIGLLTGYRVLDLAAAYRIIYRDEPPRWFYSMRSLLAAWDDAVNVVKKLEREAKQFPDSSYIYHDPDAISYAPPIHDPRKILCVAANYPTHSKELKTEIPEEPYFFGKFPNTLVGHGCDVVIPLTLERLDYEVELAVIIGKRGKYITAKKALDHVAGYSVFNDVTSRERQIPGKSHPFGFNWILGKSLDTAAPFGPYLVTRDEIDNPHSLRLTLRVNGEIRQDGNTGEMFHKIEKLIEYISNGITLEPGDVIATGTPAGVAAGGKEYLKPNDVMEAEIEKIGKLRNRVVKEK